MGTRPIPTTGTARRSPTDKVRPNHTKRMGTRPIHTLFKRFHRNWFDALMETWRSNAVLGVDTGTII